MGETKPKLSEDIQHNLHLVGGSSGSNSGIIALASGAFILVAGMVAAAGPSTEKFAFLLIPAVPVFLWSGFQWVAVAFFGGGPRHRTREAVEKGRIGISYILGGGMSDSFVVVDDDRRLIAIEGRIFGFGDVREIAWRVESNRCRIDFTLRSGDDPVRSAFLQGEEKTRKAYARIGNSLGFN